MKKKHTLLLEATIFLIRFKTLGKLRPSCVSNGKLIILELSSSGVFSVLCNCFQESESDELCSSLLGEVMESSAFCGPSRYE